ncbi:glycosyltransferase family 4 protein [Acidaminobacter sp. JC074]|uniref:glycosyltransferase family 4 protein n=1 Tax=Acidaminobacter sp. JC074 TaxID=2530199 RepID=UPI001F0EC38E|nr:glycosyltransferase family 4 protein [Acidaminobacter sp. JC074]MCH4889586.1 glycosyltransferase family 4 protein [Acidaminobacter sp. JC074]
MKILIATDWYMPVVNGVVTSVRNLKSELKAKGHDVRILTLRQSSHQEIEDTYYIDSVGIGKLYPNARLAKSLGKHVIDEIIQWGPDIVHTQAEFNTYAFARKIRKKLNIPLVHTYHTVYEDYLHYMLGLKPLNKKFVVKFSRSVLNRTDHIIVPTNKVRRLLETYQVSKDISVIPSGVVMPSDERYDPECLRSKYNINPDDKVLLYLGRLAEEKNVEELIKFFKKCDLDRVKLMIAGDGPYKYKLEEYVADLGIKDQVIFTGMIPSNQVWRYYDLAHVFLSASTSETQGLTYIEALASGRPCICRKDSCIEDVIISYYNGFQYDDYEDFKVYLNKLLYDGDFYLDLSLNAKKHSEKYSSAVFGSAVETLYSQVIKEYDQIR